MPRLDRSLLKPNESRTHEEPHEEGNGGDDQLWVVDSERVNQFEDVQFVEELAQVVHGCEDGDMDAWDTFICESKEDSDGCHTFEVADEVWDQHYDCHVDGCVDCHLIFWRESAQKHHYSIGVHQDANDQDESLNFKRSSWGKVAWHKGEHDVDGRANHCD